jgi:hypothetical protein
MKRREVRHGMYLLPTTPKKKEGEKQEEEPGKDKGQPTTLRDCRGLREVNQSKPIDLKGKTMKELSLNSRISECAQDGRDHFSISAGTEGICELPCGCLLTERTKIRYSYSRKFWMHDIPACQKSVSALKTRPARKSRPEFSTMYSG